MHGERHSHSPLSSIFLHQFVQVLVYEYLRAPGALAHRGLVVRDTPQHLAQFVQVLVYGSYGYDTNLLALRAPGALAHRVNS
jgi:hypothetical protein